MPLIKSGMGLTNGVYGLLRITGKLLSLSWYAPMFPSSKSSTIVTACDEFTLRATGTGPYSPPWGKSAPELGR